MHTPPSSASGARKISLVKVGGSLGIASCFIVLGIFLVALIGMKAVFMLVPLAMLLAGIGIILSIIGGVMSKHEGPEETQPVAALFVSLMGLVGAAVLCMLRLP